MLNTEKLKERERDALEGYLGDQIVFTVPQTAKILNKSIRWVLEKTSNGKLRFVWLDGRKGINRAVLLEAIMEGIEK
jgi:hypothetical protein